MRLDTVWVYGVGGVGGYFGGKIALSAAASQSLATKVFFIARGRHLEEIQKEGLILNTSERSGLICRPERATEDVRDLPAPDLCLMCVKSYDLDGAVSKLAEKMHDETVVLPLLNGVDIYERVRRILHKGVVLPACVYVGTHIEEPGVVTQRGGDGIILCGADPEWPRLDHAPLVEFFARAGIRFEWRADPYKAIWEKYIFIASFSLVTACFGKTLGEVHNDAGLREKVRAIMSEIELLARKKGIDLPADVVDSSLAKAGNFPFETKTSFQRDVEGKGSVNEGDLFGGTIIRTGKALGIDTPATCDVYAQLQKAS